MLCSVPGCQNDSKFKPQGITFHVFPKQPSLRSAWLQVIGIQLWELSEKMLVCSEHFLYDDFYATKHGMRKLKPDAVPIVDQAVHVDEEEILEVCKICLTTEGKMFPIRNPKLRKAYQQLTGLSQAVSEPYVPMQLCAECAHRAVGCSRLRDKALRAHRLVLNLLADHGALTKLNLKKINRLNNRLSSNLLIRHYPPNHADLHLDDNVDEQTVREIIDETFDRVKTDISDDIDESSLDGEAIKEDLLNYDLKKEYIEIDNVQSDDSSEESFALQPINGETDINCDSTSVNNFPIPRMTKEAFNSDADGMINEYFTVTETTFDEELDIILKRKNSDATYKNSVFKCTVCFKGFSDKMAHRSHMLHHTKKYDNNQCDICKIYFRSRLGKINYITNHNFSQYSCKRCPYVTKYRTAARCHINRHTGMSKNHASELLCELCGFTFASERGKQLHKLRKHTFDNQINLKLRDHRWSHTREISFPCDLCGKAFKAKARMAAHRRLHSPNRATYACHLCGKEFSQWSNRYRHVKQVHSDKRPFKCEFCDKAFKCLGDKRTHVTYVHMKKPWPKRNRERRRPTVTVIPKSPKETETTASEMDIAQSFSDVTS